MVTKAMVFLVNQSYHTFVYMLGFARATFGLRFKSQAETVSYPGPMGDPQNLTKIAIPTKVMLMREQVETACKICQSIVHQDSQPCTAIDFSLFCTNL